MASRDRLLSVLHEIQDRSAHNFLSADELDAMGRRFNLSAAELRGVASYYSMLSLAPRGRHIVRVCVSPVCRMLGSLDLLDLIEAELGISVGETTPDGLFTLEETQCLGRCSGAPALMVGERIFEGLDADKARSILQSFRSAGEGGHG